jgi:hypothetical protein
MSTQEPPEYALCPRCKKFQNKNDWSFFHEFCLDCGTKLIQECPGCKKPIYAPTNCCGLCGHRLL